MAKIEDYKFKGKTVEIGFNPPDKFSAEYDGEKLLADSYSKLKDKIMQRINRKKAEYPVSQLCYDPEFRYDGKRTVRHGICTGLHGSTNHPMVKWNGRKSAEQVASAWGESKVLRGLSPDEAQELIRLHKAKGDTADALEKFIASHEFEYQEPADAKT